MAFPTQTEVEIPLLKVLVEAGGEAQARDIYGPVAEYFPTLTRDEQEAYLENNRIKKWPNLVQWVRKKLIDRGEMDAPSYGVWRITPKSRARLTGFATVPLLEPSTVRRVPEPEPEEVFDSGTPEEILEVTHRKLRDTLAGEVLAAIARCSPQFFERLVVDLLVRMGYGGTLKDAEEAIGQVRDGGVDGIIKEDRLGLDVVYIQAKRWDSGSIVGRPDVQKFAGALQGHRARKGVLITTSTFSRDAVEYASQIDSRIVLIDGQMLARLMIDFGLGVTHLASYELKQLDSDYFENE